ncbi:MAG: cellulose binding domain-containing protein [Chloroflexota bacterium]
MKKLLVVLFVLSLVLSPAIIAPAVAQTSGGGFQASQTGPDSYEVQMISRQFIPTAGLSKEDRLALEQSAAQAMDEGRQRIHVLLQLKNIPSESERNALARQGVILLEYIPNYAWLAAIPATRITEVAAIPEVRWLGYLDAADKTDASLSLQASTWAYQAETDRAALYVFIHKDVAEQDARELLEQYGEIRSYASAANAYVLWIDSEAVPALLAADIVSWVQPADPKLEMENTVARQQVDGDTLDSAAYGNADGSNVDILIYDGGSIRSTHQELAGRVTAHDAACGVANHATHVACTTSASGIVGNAIGLGNDMHALLSDCMSTDTGVFYYTDPGELQADLVYAKDTWNPSGGDADGAELFNASVGTNTAPNGFPCAYEGNYGATAIIIDNVVRGDVAASGKLIAIWANGNERGYGTCGNSYHTTAPPACNKNAINIGATNKDADTMTSFSSWGPCDDGRIKPLVSAPGCATSGGVYSCSSSSDTAYTTMCGTSMASPVTAGVVAQLIEYCRTQGLSSCSADGEFWPSSARALLMHAAVDLGNTGPDYQFGYGRVDADAAADLLTHAPGSNDADLRQFQIGDQGEVHSYPLVISNAPSQLKISLAWDDEAATMQALTKLVNDLDLEVVSPDGAVYHPYILDPDNPASAATTGADHINNQEQVVVANPANGTWTVRVIANTLPVPNQDYSLIFPGAYAVSPTTTPGSTPTTTPTPDPAQCSEFITNGGLENGSTGWTISGSAAHSDAYAQAGTYAMLVGGTANGAFYQDFTVPADMYTGTISFWYRMQTSESSHPWDFFDVEIRDAATGEALTTLLSTDDSKPNATWTEVSLAVGPEYAGRSLRLSFSGDVDSSVNTYWYTDEVSVNLCRLASSTATPTATATAATPTSTPTATATANTPTNTVTPTPDGACQVDYSARSWSTGFTADVKIINNSPATIAGWTLTYIYNDGQQITNAWNATVTQSGADVTASNPSSHWNGSIPANGGSVTFGTQGSYTNTNSAPTNFILNGTPCSRTTSTSTATATATAATPTATPTATATANTPTNTVTPTPDGACQVDYSARSWSTGFTADVKIINNSPATIAGWTLTYIYNDGQQITNAWNATVTQSGADVTASNPSSHWNGSIPANGGSVTFGTQGSYTNTNSAPTNFILNGTACNSGNVIISTVTPTAGP